MSGPVAAAYKALSIERLSLILLFAAATMGVSIYNADVFLHLATGRYILESGALPQGDPFSFTRAGEPWNLHEWLYQLVLFWLYKHTGLTGIKLAGALLFVSTLYLTRRNCELVGAGPTVAWGVTLTGLVVWVNFLGARPHMLSFLLFALMLHALLRYRMNNETRLLYLLPPLMTVWVNSHGGFIIGLVLLGYFAVVQFIENRLFQANLRRLLPLVMVFLVSVLATLINPNGIEQLLFPFFLVGQWAIRYIAEWRAPDYAAPNTLVYIAMVASFVFATLCLRERRSFFTLVVSVPFVIASFLSMRHIPIALLFISPYLAAAIEQCIVRYKRKKSVNEHAEISGATAPLSAALNRNMGEHEYTANWVVLLLGLLGMYAMAPLITQHRMHSISGMFPIGATRFLQQQDIRGRMFTSMQYSDYILFRRYPQQKVFFDVRVETYGEELARDYLGMLYANEGWRGKFAKYRIDFAVLNKSEPIYAAMMKAHYGRVIYEDRYDVVICFSCTSAPATSPGYHIKSSGT